MILSCCAEVAEPGPCRRGTVNAESIADDHSGDARCHAHVHKHTPQTPSTMADLTRTDRLQPGRGCTSPTSQRLHIAERAIPRFNVAASESEAVRQCGTREAWTQGQTVESAPTRTTAALRRKSRSILSESCIRPSPRCLSMELVCFD